MRRCTVDHCRARHSAHPPGKSIVRSEEDSHTSAVNRPIVRRSRLNTIMRIIRFRPSESVFHRYTASDMCGVLPPVLYKVLSRKYAERLLSSGEMMWSTLTW